MLENLKLSILSCITWEIDRKSCGQEMNWKPYNLCGSFGYLKFFEITWI